MEAVGPLLARVDTWVLAGIALPRPQGAVPHRLVDRGSVYIVDVSAVHEASDAAPL